MRGGLARRPGKPTAVGQRRGADRRPPAHAALTAVRERGITRTVDGMAEASTRRCVGSRSDLPP